MKIPVGCYEIDTINNKLQELTVEAGGEKDKVIVSPNNTTLQVELNINDKEYMVDFNIEHSLRTVLGFNAKRYTFGTHANENPVVIMSVNSIMVHCDIIIGSRLNGMEAPVIYNFFPDARPGDKIISTPKNLVYVPLTMDVLSHMTYWLTDQNGRELDLRGEELTITFYMKACGS